MSTGTCACARHDAVEWIRVGFGDCVSSGTDFAGFVFGMMSICCWLVAQVPQFVQNFRSGSAEGLSPWFLAEWLLGDTFNLLGCLMTGDQLASETYTAGYFMCVDVVMIFQFVYYTLRSREALGIITLDLRDPRGPGDGRDARRGGLRRRLLGNSRDDNESNNSSESDGESFSESDEDSGTVFESIFENKAPAPRGGGGFGGTDTRRTRNASRNGATGLNASRNGATGCFGSLNSRSRGIAAYAMIGAAAVGAAVGIALVGTSGRFVGKSSAMAPFGSRAAPPSAFGDELSRSYQGVKGLSSDEHTQHRHLYTGNLPLCGSTNNPKWEVSFGRAVGYVSALFYLGSRVSQILKNKSRRSVEGVSVLMFAVAAVANTLYGTAILVRADTFAELVQSVPWLLGSLGTVALDSTILAQSWVYAKGRVDEDAETTDADDEENDLNLAM